MLYIVGTPIGNLGDFTPRAIEVLKTVDFIAAEDTRVTVKLLNHFGIETPMISYYEHNLRQKGEYILSRLQNGESCAIVTDAGMPCISDPGEDLVKLCAANDVPVCVVPGPSAVVSALAASALPTGRFTFEGFLSVNRPQRLKHLEEIKEETRTMIFYEAPHKLLATLEDFVQTFGADRKITLSKELTKLHETHHRTTVGEAAAYYTENKPKGEFVLVVEGVDAAAREQAVKDSYTLEDAAALVRQKLEAGEKLTAACKEVAKLTGQNRAELYRIISNE